jgi:TrpR family trp operon transcriptional repressor
MKTDDKHHALFRLIASVKNAKEAELLLKDLLTPQEIDSVAERVELVRALASGKPQRSIAQDLGVSISKITRGSRVLKYGTGALKRSIMKLLRS